RIYLLFSVIGMVLTQLCAQSQDSLDTYIDSIYLELPEVMIKGERPIVKATQGKLVYDIPRLIND
ncbi:hypothetical protein NE451_21335, partial [Bacteroides nordii]